MKKAFVFIFGIALFASACTDSAKDPLQFAKIEKGSILALRGAAFENLSDATYRGANDRFIRTGDPATENFDFDVEYLSDTPDNLSEVQVYVRESATGARQRVTTVPASAFTAAAGENRKASVKVSLPSILTALNKSATDFAKDSYIYVETDILLTDGTVVKAADVVNSGLFSSAIFFPAHNMLYIAGE